LLLAKPAVISNERVRIADAARAASKGRREEFHRRGAEYAESEDFDKNFFLGALGVSAVRYFRVLVHRGDAEGAEGRGPVFVGVHSGRGS